MMTTRPTRATRSEHGASYRKTADEENEIGCAQCVSGSLGVKRAISRILSTSPTMVCGWVVTEARLRLGTSL
jgi:hypothetical protein